MGSDAAIPEGIAPPPNHVLEDIAEAFNRNVELVHELANFDHLVLDLAIQALERVKASADRSQLLPHHRLNVIQQLQQLRSIRSNDSLRSQYQHIFNQCVVLLASYFASAIQELFVASVAERLTSGAPRQLLDMDLKLSVAQLLEISGDPHQRVANLLTKKGGISFQDMQSIGRAFRDFCEVEPVRDGHCNNIILGQACRHVIVHSGAVVDDKCLKQVKAATPRVLKADLAAGPVQFSVEELKVLACSMSAYMGTLLSGLSAS